MTVGADGLYEQERPFESTVEGKPVWLPKIDCVRVPQRVLNSVVFLGGRTTPGDPKTEIFGGTGFLVAIEETGIFFPYIVTAHHVAELLDQMKEPIARLNDGQGRGHHFRLLNPTHVEIGGQTFDTPAWYRHPSDTGADVAVAAFSPSWVRSWTDGPFAYVPTWMCVPEKELHATRGEIGIGDEVFIAGLFAHVRGKDANSPLLRIGNIAMLPRERINVGAPYGFMEAYLVEAKSTGGISGSPVFVRGTRKMGVAKVGELSTEPETVVSSADYGLLGLAHGHWDIPSADMNDPNPSLGHGNLNIGLAIVTPAKKILETLDHPKLVAQRKDFAESVHKNGPKTMLDSAWSEETTFTRDERGGSLRDE
jgi:hypothetical protein